MQKNEYLVAKFGFDTAENEPSKVAHLLEPESSTMDRLLRALGEGRLALCLLRALG